MRRAGILEQNRAGITRLYHFASPSSTAFPTNSFIPSVERIANHLAVKMESAIEETTDLTVDTFAKRVADQFPELQPGDRPLLRLALAKARRLIDDGRLQWENVDNVVERVNKFAEDVKEELLKEEIRYKRTDLQNRTLNVLVRIMAIWWIAWEEHGKQEHARRVSQFHSQLEEMQSPRSSRKRAHVVNWVSSVRFSTLSAQDLMLTRSQLPQAETRRVHKRRRLHNSDEDLQSP